MAGSGGQRDHAHNQRWGAMNRPLAATRVVLGEFSISNWERAENAGCRRDLEEAQREYDSFSGSMEELRRKTDTIKEAIDQLGNHSFIEQASTELANILRPWIEIVQTAELNSAQLQCQKLGNERSASMKAANAVEKRRAFEEATWQVEKI